MGRKSKRLHVSGSSHEGDQRDSFSSGRCYKAGIYARLSSAQEEKSESLDAQVEIARKFAEERNRDHEDRIEVKGLYMDSGRTGTNFDRDAFKRLMQDIRMGDINCVIVKDLSRFGRNYLEAGDYIEKIFPFLGVRFIAVADGYDSTAAGNDTKQMGTEIKNLVNDMYAKDASVRAKISLTQRRQNGSYVGGPPPYGYTACREGERRRLIPDENTAEIVRYIYGKFIETGSYTQVAEELNRRRIQPPAVYKKCREVYCPPDKPYKGWNKSAVERILKSETYVGTLAQGKTSVTARDERNRTLNAEDKWTIKEQAHEPLITQGTYERAGRVRKKPGERAENRERATEGCSIGEDVFDQILFCGICGQKMTRYSHVKICPDGSKTRLEGYYCLNGSRTRRDGRRCPNVESDGEGHWHFVNTVSKNRLSDILSTLLETEFAMGLGKQKKYVEIGRKYILQKSRQPEQKQKATQKAMERLNEEEGEAYMEYCMGSLSQQDYIRCKRQREKRFQELLKKEMQLKEEKNRLKKAGEGYLREIRSLVKGKGRKELSKESAESLIKKIYIYPGKRMEVVFAFQDYLFDKL